MGYIIVSNGNLTSFTLGVKRGSWRMVGAPAGTQNLTSVNQSTWDPGRRMRNTPHSGNLFTRDWSSATDGHLPLPFSIPSQTVTPSPVSYSLSLATPYLDNFSVTLVILPDPVVFSLGLASTKLNRTLTPSPVTFNLSTVSVLFGRSLVPSPIVFSLGLVALGQLNWTVKPSPAAFALTMASVTLGKVLYPDPLAFALGLTAGQLNRIVKPNPVTFAAVMASVSLSKVLFPNPISFALSLINPLLDASLYLRPNPLVFTLLPIGTTMVPGEVFLAPDALRYTMAMPYPLANYYAGAVSADTIKSVTYLVRASHPDVGTQDIPASSIQSTAQSLALYASANPSADLTDQNVGPQDDFSFQVPNGATYLAILSDYLAADGPTSVQALERVTYSNGYVSDRTVASSVLSSISRNRGPRNDTLSVRCSSRSQGPATKVITIPQNRIRTTSYSGGTSSAQLAYDLSEVRASRTESVGQIVSPGDTVTVDGQTYVVAKVSLNLSPSDRYLGISSGN